MNIIYIIISIVIIILIAWIYFCGIPFISKSEQDRLDQVRITLQLLQNTVDTICAHCNFSPIYTMHETRDLTYTQGNDIYICIWDWQNNRLYDFNTLIYAALHEIAHVLSPSIHHNPPFDTIENLLFQRGQQLGIYDPTKPIDPHYLCLT